MVSDMTAFHPHGVNGNFVGLSSYQDIPTTRRNQGMQLCRDKDGIDNFPSDIITFTQHEV
jgi:hypothetical protein